MPTWTGGWAVKKRYEDRACTRAEARGHLEVILTNLSWVQYYSDMLDQLNASNPTYPYSLKMLGYLNCRDAVMANPTVWAELDDEAKCHLLVEDDEDIRSLTIAALDGVMNEYDETVWEDEE